MRRTSSAALVPSSVSTAWLAKCLGDPLLRVVDVRLDAPQTDRGDRSEVRLRAAELDPPRFVELGPNAGWLRAGRWTRSAEPPATYLRGHVPGALHLDVGGSLFDRDGGIAGAPELAMVMSLLGIGDAHTIVLVDDAYGHVADVAAWVLDHYGHAASVLEGGFSRWLTEGRPVSRDRARQSPASFTASVATSNGDTFGTTAPPPARMREHRRSSLPPSGRLPRAARARDQRPR